MVAYAGLIGYNQGLGVLLQAARMLPDVDFVLAGDGPELALLKRRPQELGVGNVSFSRIPEQGETAGALPAKRRPDRPRQEQPDDRRHDGTRQAIRVYGDGQTNNLRGQGIAAELMRR